MSTKLISPKEMDFFEEPEVEEIEDHGTVPPTVPRTPTLAPERTATELREQIEEARAQPLPPQPSVDNTYARNSSVAVDETIHALQLNASMRCVSNPLSREQGLHIDFFLQGRASMSRNLLRKMWPSHLRASNGFVSLEDMERYVHSVPQPRRFQQAAKLVDFTRCSAIDTVVQCLATPPYMAMLERLPTVSRTTSEFTDTERCRELFRDVAATCFALPSGQFAYLHVVVTMASTEAIGTTHAIVTEIHKSRETGSVLIQVLACAPLHSIGFDHETRQEIAAQCSLGFNQNMVLRNGVSTGHGNFGLASFECSAEQFRDSSAPDTVTIVAVELQEPYEGR